eukprot:scpid32102/ scgid21352/ Poly [ADP-ribose] polymerase 1; NAD(+) ADP-ribosyltransferase 1; Poly[ADP-ribose] synthase 1
MSDDLPFKAEYAKSGRSSCKACKSAISKDSLRLAKMVQSPHFDGKMPTWFHIACFFKKNAISSQGDIGGFDGLRWDDQQMMKQRIAGGGGAVGGSVAAPTGKVADRLRTRADLQVEYAKSNRAMCNGGCGANIAKNEVRIAKMDDPDPDAMYGHGNLIPRWHHVECFVKRRAEIDVSEDVSADMLTGFKQMKKADQEMLTKSLGGPVKTEVKPKKRKAEDEIDGGAPLKKVKSPEEEKEEKTLKDQSESVWKIRDKLRQFVSNNGLKELLEENSQDVPSGESRLLDRTSDMFAFGAVERCSTCKTGQFVLRGDLYACSGNLTEWTKCQETTLDPKRFKPVVPATMLDIEYLKTFKFKVKKRIFPKLTAIATSDSLASASSLSTRPADLPFKDLKFAFVGRVKGKAAMEKRIAELGGKVATKISDELFCVVSIASEVSKMSDKIKAAEAADVPVVDDSFVEDAAAGAMELKINNHKLATWGLKKHHTKSGGAPVKSSAKRSAGTDSTDGGAAKKMKISVKGGAAVDPESGMESTCHVLEESGGNIYSATLGMVDIQRGTNSYYKLQVLEQDKGARWHVFRAWGRVGTTIGGNKTEPYHSRDNAKAQFTQLYQEKTGNAWSDRKHFVKVVGKFYPLEIDYGQDNEDLKKMKLKVQPGSKSKLARPIQELVEMLFDIEKMESALIEFEIDMKKMPLGKLSRRQIENAYKVLNEALKEMEGAKNATRLLDASNRFYTLIPHDFGMQKPPLLDNDDLIKSKCTMLDSLLEIEVAYNLLKQSGGNEADDPIDLNYKKLNTDMEVLSHDHPEFKMIKTYIANTHASTHNQYELELLEVFKVERESENDRYKKFCTDDNRMLLWHGSRTTNFCGILSQGLRIAPPEAPVTGYMFGKGVYFADMVSKSANYCRTSPTDNIGMLLLCEVALGGMYERTHSEYVNKLPSGKLSTKGIGRTAPDPSGDKTLDNGCVVPMGKGANVYKGQTSLLYNEFIVYDVSQIQMKYLLKVDFKYKSRSWF